MRNSEPGYGKTFTNHWHYPLYSVSGCSSEDKGYIALKSGMIKPFATFGVKIIVTSYFIHHIEQAT